MKKSELTQLTQVIERLVAREVRKQLPKAIAEVFQSMGKTAVREEKKPIQEQAEPIQEEVNEFKASLKELFAGVTPVTKTHLETPVERPMRQYTKNPVLNQILNETNPDLRSRERMVGMAAFQGGYSPNLPAAGPGPMMPEAEMPSFAKNMPSIPVGTPPVLQEGKESTHVPLEALPEGVSALDVAKQVPLAAPVAQALTRNYKDMMKLIDQKQGRKK